MNAKNAKKNKDADYQDLQDKNRWDVDERWYF